MEKDFRIVDLSFQDMVQRKMKGGWKGGTSQLALRTFVDIETVTDSTRDSFLYREHIMGVTVCQSAIQH